MPIDRSMTSTPPPARVWRFGALVVPAWLMLSAGAIHGSPLLQARPDPPAAGAAAVVVEEEEIDWLRSIVANASNGLEIRRRAAEKLLRMPTPLAIGAIVGAFEESTDADRPALRAIFEDATVESPELAEAFIDALPVSAAKDRPRLLALLADLGPGVDELVAVVAVDPRRDVRARLMAVEALGGLPTRTSVESLLVLVAEGREETAEMRSRVFRALEKISGVPLGEDAEAWRRWWREGGESTLERTCEERVADLAAQIGRLDRDRRGIEDRADRTAVRLRVLLADVLVGLEPAARQERVQRLLGDELESLRELAVEQVDRAFRNGDRIGEETIARLATLLDDPSLVIRGKAARLLGTLGWEPIAEEVARRLKDEFDPELGSIYLEVLAERPRADTLPVILGRLGPPGTSDAAARAIFRLVTAGLAPADWRVLAVPAARTIVEVAPTPQSVRLLALAGEDADRALLEALLDRDNPAVRRAVAEGWTRSGRLDSLRPRLRDPVVFAAVVGTIAAGPSSLEAVTTLLGLDRPAEDAGAADLDAALVKILAGLPANQLVQADDLLAGNGVGLERRLASLARPSSDDVKAMTPLDRDRLLERRASLLLTLARAEEAADLLEPFAIMTEQALSPILFEARLRAGRFDRAAAQHALPAPWLDVLERLALSDPAEAEVLLEEVDRRFGGRLSPEQSARASAIRASLELLPTGPPAP